MRAQGRDGLNTRASQLEQLEPRLALSVVSWTGAGDGVSWHDGSNWDTGAPPGLVDDAVISVAADPNIAFTSLNGDRIIRSLQTTETISFQGGSLSILDSADVDAPVTLDGGKLLGGHWDVTGGTLRASRVYSVIGGGMVLTGDIDMTSTSGTVLSVANGLTLFGTIYTQSGADLRFEGSQQFSEGTIRLQSSEIYAYGQLEFGPAVRVEVVGGGAVQPDDGVLINRGTISVTGGTLEIEAGSFINHGTVLAAAGTTLELSAEATTNTGTVTASGSTLRIGRDGAAWSNTGVIDASNAVVQLYGAFRSADIGAGVFSRQGGTVTLFGDLDNAGTVLSLTGSLLGLTAGWGSITGGTVVVPPGSEFLVRDLDLQGPLTFNGDILATTTSGEADLGIYGEATVNGVIRLGKDSGLHLLDGGWAGIRGVEVLPLATGVAISTRGAAILGPDTVITIGARAKASISAVYNGTASLTLQGLIAMDGQFATLSMGADHLTNEGVIRAGSDTQLGIGGTYWSNEGVVLATGAKLVTLGTESTVWRNAGQFVLVNSHLELGGTVATADLGWEGFTILETSVDLIGTIDNTGDVFVLGENTGVWQVWEFGGFRGGEVIIESGYAPEMWDGRLEGPLKLTGTLPLSTGGFTLRVTGGLTLDGEILLYGSADLELDHELTLDGGVITIVDSGDIRLTGVEDKTATLGPALSLVVAPGATGRILRATGNDGPLHSRALITLADENASLEIDLEEFRNEGLLQVRGTVELLCDRWSNPGQISMLSGTLQIDAEATTDDVHLAGWEFGGGLVRLLGVIDNTDATLNLPDAAWVLTGGEIIGGVVNVAGTLRVSAGSPSRLTGPIELHGNILVEDLTEATLNIEGGLLLVGTIRLGANGDLGLDGDQTLSSGVIELSGLGQDHEIRLWGQDAVITLGAGLLIRGGHADEGRILSTGTGQTLINLGEIRSDVPGHGIEIRATRFENRGLVACSSDGTLTVSGSWTNLGQVAVNGGRLNLAGTFSTSDLGLDGFARNGGTIAITGALTNTDQTLALPQTLGSWTLDGGTIIGGEVSMSPIGTLLIGPGAGKLQGPIGIVGSINAATIPYARITITGGLTLAGLFRIGDGARVFLEGTQRLDIDEIRFLTGGAPPVIYTAGGANAVITLGPTTHVTGGHQSGAGIASAAGETLVLEGTLTSSLSGGSVLVLPSKFINRGEVRAANGGTAIVTAAGSYGNRELLEGTWAIEEDSRLEIPGASIVRIGPSAAVVLDGNGGAFPPLASDLQELQGLLELAGGRDFDLSPLSGALINAGRLVLGPGSVLNLDGRYEQTPEGALESWLDYDSRYVWGRLVVSGAANISGAFSVRHPATRPDEGRVFDVLEAAGGLSGAFTTILLPDPPQDGDRIAVITDGAGVRVLFTDLADLNLDGTTDTQDFIAFLGLWSHRDPRADVNGDGVIDTQDFIAYLSWWADG
ncbi:MAG: hypothetical protein IT431_10640 [Phycisphaerales bacterium]|nr:hypothetical protein [Phycisphaerales bacterium]